MDITTLALAKKYTEESLKGAGALKGEKGDKGDSYILTKEDKNEIAELTLPKISYGDQVKY